MTWSRSNKPTSKITSGADEVDSRGETITTAGGVVVVVGTEVAHGAEDNGADGGEGEEVAAHERADGLAIVHYRTCIRCLCKRTKT